MEAAQGGEKEEMKEEKVEQEKEEVGEEKKQKAKEEEEALVGRSREWATSCDKSVICDRGPGLVRLGSSLKVEERREGEEEEEEGAVERERRRRRKMGEKENGELRQTREGHRLSVVLPRQRARSPVTVQV